MSDLIPSDALHYSKADIKKLSKRLDFLFRKLSELSRFETFEPEKKKELLIIARNALNSVSMQIMRFAKQALKDKYSKNYNWVALKLRGYGYNIKNLLDVTKPISLELGKLENYANNYIDRLYGSFYNRVTLMEKEQIKIDKTVNNIAEGKLQGVLRKRMTKDAVKYLEEYYPAGTVDIPYTKINKNGDVEITSRKMALVDYAENLIDDTLSRLETQSTLDANIEAGNDLIQVVSEPNCCNICSHYSYKVFSISGTDPTFPKFTPEKEPIYHPHCRCYVVAVVTQDQVIRTDHGDLNYTENNQRHIAKRHKELVNKEHWIKNIVNNGKSYKSAKRDDATVYENKIDEKYYRVAYNNKDNHVLTFMEIDENKQGKG